MKFWLFIAVFLLFSYPAKAESRVKIAIIDTGIRVSAELRPYLCSEGHRDYSGYGLVDVVGHGTAVAKLVVQGLDPHRYCLLIYKWAHWGGDSKSEQRIVAAIRAGIAAGAKYFNMSFAGPGREAEEQIAIQDALTKGTVVVVAAGNDQCNLDKKCKIYPACYPIYSSNFHVVGNSSKGGCSNFGRSITDWAPGAVDIDGYKNMGTSFSAPRVLNRLIKEAQ